MELFEGKILEDFVVDDLQNSLLFFLESIYTYNQSIDRDGYLSVYDTFLPYMDEEFGGIFLDGLSEDELNKLLCAVYVVYAKALVNLEKNPDLPLMLDNYGSIIRIEHTA